MQMGLRRLSVALATLTCAATGHGQISLQTLTGLPKYATVDVSPDGRRIVYSGGSGLYVRDFAGGRPQKIAGAIGEAWPYGPRWSPDGKWIAFIYSGSIPDERLYFMPADGGKPRFLANLCPDGAHFSWTKDSESLIIALPRSAGAWDPPCRLGVYRISAHKVDRFLTLGESPAVSPDGRTMAFVRGQELRLIPFLLEGKASAEETLVVREARRIESPIWSADGSALMYSTGGECSEVHHVEARAGATPVRVPGLPEGLSGVSATANRDLVVAEISAATTRRYRLDTHAASPEFTPRAELFSRGALAPNGGATAYTSCSMNGSQIMINTRRSTESVLVAPRGAPLSEPVWSPDGNWILFTEQPGSLVGHGYQEESLFLVSASGGVPRRLLPDFYSVNKPWWSLNSQTIYFTGQRDSSPPIEAHLWSVRASDGKLTQLTRRTCPSATPAFNGPYAYCHYYESGSHVYRVSLDGREEPDLPGMIANDSVVAGYDDLFLTSRDGVLWRYELARHSLHRLAKTPPGSRLEGISGDFRYLTVVTRVSRQPRTVVVRGLR